MRSFPLFACLLSGALGASFAAPADARSMHCRWAIYGTSVLGIDGDTNHYGFDFDDADADGSSCTNTCNNDVGRNVATGNDKDPYPQYHVTETRCDTGHVCSTSTDKDPDNDGCRL